VIFYELVKPVKPMIQFYRSYKKAKITGNIHLNKKKD